MVNLLSENIYIIFLLPLWIFLVIMLGRFFSVYVNKFILYFLTLFSSFIGIISAGLLLLNYLQNKIYEFQLPFIKINDFIISGGFYVDKISLLFALILFLVSFCVQIFSISYTKNDKKNYRFFALLNLFNFSIAGMFFSPNLYQLFVFWEITAIVSYLLIGFNYFDKKKSTASKKVFIINRIGDTALIGGILYCSYIMWEYSPSKDLATLSLLDINTISTFIYAYTSDIGFVILCSLFLLSAFIKSAQFPFHTWLQDAMEAKLPVSSLLHSATLVAAGLYLVIRLMQFFVLNNILIKIIFLIGLTTAILCSLFALFENNYKKVLAYSTSAQYGLILIAIAQLNIKIAILLYIAHAFTKSMLFLTLPNDKNEWTKFDIILFIFGALSLCGVALSGFEAKEIFFNNSNLRIILPIISFLSATYITGLFFKLKENTSVLNNKIDLIKILSSSILLGLNILFALYLRYRFSTFSYELLIFALLGIIITCLFCHKKYKLHLPIIFPLLQNAFYIDKLYTDFIPKIYNKISHLCSEFDTKIMANYRPIIKLASFMVKLNFFIEEKIINRFISLITKSVNFTSIHNIKSQTGNIQSYNFYAFIIITTIIASLIIIYTTILGFVGS